ERSLNYSVRPLLITVKEILPEALVEFLAEPQARKGAGEPDLISCGLQPRLPRSLVIGMMGIRRNRCHRRRDAYGERTSEQQQAKDEHSPHALSSKGRASRRVLQGGVWSLGSVSHRQR